MRTVTYEPLYSRSTRQIESLDAHILLEWENSVMMQLSGITRWTSDTLRPSVQVRVCKLILTEPRTAA